MEEMDSYLEFVEDVFNRYCPVSKSSVQLLLDHAEIHHGDKGEMLLSVGEVSRDNYILYSGAVVSYVISEEGTPYHKNIFLKGDFVGSKVSALTKTSSRFALEAIEKSVLITFNYQKYRQLLNENEELKNFYVSYLEKNWIIDKEKREVEIVLLEAKERYLDFIKNHPNIESRIPLHYIASHLGITPTQLSRIRNKLKKKLPTQHM